MDISLSLSGGGFRASAFSHGAILLLHKLDLLKHVNVISSVSGGTITATIYSLYGRDFLDFNRRIEKVHNVDNLIERAQQVLAEKQVNVPSKRQNLITAFAEVYDQDIFEGALFEDLWDKNKIPIGLTDIIFNSTEFKTATGFRFQKALSNRAKIGNGNISIKKDLAFKLRFADILAASSCFPAGFEPLSLPFDFKLGSEDVNKISKHIASELKNLNNKNQKKGIKELALMDGGIYDNQGIESALYANKRNKVKPDLFLIIDVSSAAQDIYDIPKFKTRKWIWGVKIKWLLWIMLLLLLILCLVPLVSISFGNSTMEHFPDKDLFILPNSIIKTLSNIYLFTYSILTIGIVYLGVRLWKIRRNIKEKLPTAYNSGISILKTRTLGQINDMINTRIGSVVALATEVFLKRARAQVYEDAIENEDIGKNVVVAILKKFDKYDGKQEEDVPRELYLDPTKIQHKRILDICQNASKMPTTLWFKNDIDKKNKLIVAGYVILCYSLFKYLANKKITGTWEDDLLNKVKQLWSELILDPYLLLHENNLIEKHTIPVRLLFNNFINKP